MKKLISMSLFLCNIAFAESMPVNSNNLKCVVEEYQNDGHKMYWGFAIYKNKYKIFLKGNARDSSPVYMECLRVEKVISLADINGGYLDVVVSKKKFRSDCIDDTIGSWGRTTGNSSYSVKEVEFLQFPNNLLTLNYETHSTVRQIGYCSEHTNG